MTRTAKTIGRRELLKGGGVAALAVGAAAVVPFAANAAARKVAPAVVGGSDTKVMSLGEQCLVLAREAIKLREISSDARDAQEAAFKATGASRWKLDTPLGRTLREEGGKWQVVGNDIAPDWYAHSLGDDYPETYQTRWFPLAAKSEAQAAREAGTLDRELDAEWWAAYKRCGLPLDSRAHFDNWCAALGKLDRHIGALAKLRARTPEGLAMKALVLAVGHDAWDDPDCYEDKLRDSIMADIAKNARAA